MKKNYFLLILLLSLNGFAQINFEKGYYLNNLNERIEGFIKNEDWKNNPTEFEFKSTENGTNEKINIENASEFGFIDDVSYLRADVDIEKSSDRVYNLQIGKTPKITNERLYLKKIVDGTNKLYIYNEGPIEKFFYSVNNGPIKQLIYIKYLPAKEDFETNNNLEANNILTNDYYKRQLWYDVKCENTSQSDIKKLEYKLSKLVDYFEKINDCKGDVKSEKKSNYSASFNFKVSAIYNLSSLEVTYPIDTRNANFSNSNFGFGFETEIILPFNRNKWSIVLEPSYNQFKDTHERQPKTNFEDVIISRAEYKYFQVPFAVRHYFFLSTKSKLFVNAVANVRISNKNNGVFYSNMKTSNFEFTGTSFSFAAGLGYNYGKLNAEARYYLTSNVTAHSFIPMDFKNTSLILRYEVFGRARKK